MDKWNRNIGEPPENLSGTATKSAPKPGDCSLGSLASRAAARAVIRGKSKTENVMRISYIAPNSEEVDHYLIKIPAV